MPVLWKQMFHPFFIMPVFFAWHFSYTRRRLKWLEGVRKRRRGCGCDWHLLGSKWHFFLETKSTFYSHSFFVMHQITANILVTKKKSNEKKILFTSEKKNNKKHSRLISFTNNSICSTTNIFLCVLFLVTTHCNHNLSLSLCLESLSHVSVSVCVRIRALMWNMLISNHKLKAMRLQFGCDPYIRPHITKGTFHLMQATIAAVVQKLILVFFFSFRLAIILNYAFWNQLGTEQNTEYIYFLYTFFVFDFQLLLFWVCLRRLCALMLRRRLHAIIILNENEYKTWRIIYDY